ncbi:MAG: 23S rRNA (uracil(1939)-C(5))-methyltransferase RlmD [Clostridia bacterium]|nr:23S rRNA (uracil(1939)-C(5))-methyltransferase RlmD [Clostridia bacterium]
MVKIGDIYTVRIEDVNIFANGVCHIDGLVVFVKGALTNEECVIKITELHSKFAYAIITDFIKKSSKRLGPSCQAYGACGGCSFLHTDISKENEIKENYLKAIVKKNYLDIEVENIQTPTSQNCRNKVVLFFENGKYGYMANGTNKIVEHTSCMLNEDIFDKIATFTSVKLKGTSIRALYMRKSSKYDEIMVCPIFYDKADIVSYTTELVANFPSVKTVLYSIYKEKDFALEKAKFKTIYGDGYIYDELCGLKFRISPSSFYQVNPACAELLYNKTIELADLTDSDTCADLFCGTGTIGLICAKKTGANVYGVEINEDAVKDAKFNAKLNDISNISFESTDAKNFNKNVDVCIVDPPRKGCSQFMIETLLRLKPKRIVYVSCNADTLMRDLKALQNEYNIASPLYPFNMFPKTSHVENVICLNHK